LEATSPELRTVSLRPNAITGVGSIGWDNIEKGNPDVRVFGSGYQGWVYVESLATVLINCAKILEENPAKISGKFYYIADLNMRGVEVAPMFAAICGHKYVLKNLQPIGTILKNIAKFIDWIHFGENASSLSLITDFSKAASESNVQIDCSAAIKDLHFVPLKLEEIFDRMKIKIQNKNKSAAINKQ